jgi:ABC-type branched-subunit amino acid transport system ATPase component
MPACGRSGPTRAPALPQFHAYDSTTLSEQAGSTLAEPRTSLVAARRLYAGYHGHPVVHGVDLDVAAGEVVVLLGANGAGKTTTLRTLAGELAPVSGDVLVDGAPTNVPIDRRARDGLAFVPEERTIYSKLTVHENLKVARCELARALELFPELKPLLKRSAGLCSGGEQQMLVLAKALARGPRCLLADELSLGLAPRIVTRLLDAVRRAADAGIGVILVEQHVPKALAVADRALVMRRGQIVLEGTRSELVDRADEIQALYLAR